MSRITKKFIKLGTGSDELNARDISANYTPSNYSPVQAGSEGADKVSAHLKGVDAALSASSADVSASLANNQAAPANVTGLSFNPALIRSAEIHYSITINATSSLFEAGTLVVLQKNSGWNISQTCVGDDTGIVLSITSSGQVQYTSPAFTGFSSATIKFRAITTTV